MMKLLYAGEVPNGGPDDTALVIDCGNDQIIGGVAVMTKFVNNYRNPSLMDALRRTNIASTEMNFTWRWQTVITRAQYEAQRDRPQELTEPPPKIIEHKP